MITDRLYYENTYESEFYAKVLSCEKSGEHWYIVLDRTCFYPEGGGQPGDTGFLNDVRITDCRTIAKAITHIAENPLEPGTTVYGKIDFLRRFTFMQNHTGEHILSGIVKKLYGFDNVGFHLSENNMTMDFNGELSKEDLLEIEELANKSVYSNITTEISLFDSAKLKELNLDYRSKKELDGSVRIVSVPWYDACACAGLHVHTSGEVGVIKVISAQRYKGGSRVYALCGYNALEDYRMKNDNILKISTLLSVKPHEISTAVEKTITNISEQKRLISALRSEVFALKAQCYAEGTPMAYVFENGLEPADLLNFANEIASRAKVAFVFSNSVDSINVYKYAICSQSPSLGLAEIAKGFNQALGGRGGIKNNIAQGVVNASKDSIEAFVTDPTRNWS
ncbi:MAG: alanine--tRNA ligase-related protein [Defluviitaleaceae bacterium]|nr:alanine--tRNA ligase-related protein [Defluviitaleaceae bacterium]